MKSKKQIPFSPFSDKMTDSLARKFLIVGDTISKKFPSLELNLLQAKMDIQPRKYAAIAFVIATFYGVMFLTLFMLLIIILKIDILLLGILFSAAFFIFMLFAGIMYPTITARKRMRVLEANLVPALRHLLIEIKSGVSLFQAFNGVSEGYGEVSDEFKRVVKDINTGKGETDALDEAAHRNPSFKFRRALWQITNAIKSGADVGYALDTIINDLTQAQITAVRRYGQELNPWTMIYMLAAVIIPSLGSAFITILSSFSGAMIPKAIFPLIVFGLLGFQLFFMNFVKSKRPAV